MPPQEIVQRFIDNGYKAMPNILNNRVYYTDNSASTLVWVEENVVIEHYFLFPNLETPMHSHPFANQLIYIEGEITAYRKTPKDFVHEDFLPDYLYVKKFEAKDANIAGRVLPIGIEHGFTVGPKGAVVYNIQIWPNTVKNPLSATIEYVGTSIGPTHDKLLDAFR